MKTIATLAAGAIALTMVAATPAAAQSYRDHRDRDRSDSSDVLIGAALGAVAGAALGNGDGAYIAGGALAGAAIAASGDNDRYDSRYGYRRGDCSYYRGGRCWRNQGHWEREHGINSRDYDRRHDRRDDRRYDRRYDERRDYRYERRW